MKFIVDAQLPQIIELLTQHSYIKINQTAIVLYQ